MRLDRHIEQYITFKEAMAMIGCSRNTLYMLVKRPDFPSYRFGRVWYIDKQGLNTWMHNQTKGYKH